MQLKAFIVFSLTVAWIGWSTVSAGAFAFPDRHGTRAEESQAEKIITVDPNVVVSVCVVSGDIRVRGWDRSQIQVRSADADGITFRRPAGARDSDPAREVTVLVAGKMIRSAQPCLLIGDIELDVPRGATVKVQTRDGNILVNGVATISATSQGGSVEVEGVKRSIEAASIGGDISLRNSSGSAKLRTIGGSIEAHGLGPAGPGDTFEVSSTGGDIALDVSGYMNLKANTVGGDLNLNGPLTRGGHYDFKTISGDLSLVLPANSSFRLDATLAHSGELVTDFPLTGGPSSMVKGSGYGMQRIGGVYGTGDALITISSFSGTVHLRKK